MSKIACLFPGQGCQSVGMGQDLYNQLPEAKKCFEEIDQIAGLSLSKLCFEGPEAELKRTINTQPTILAVSIAAWKCYQQIGGPQPDFVAGHSLGEFTALVASQVLSIEQAVKLVVERATLMEECLPGAMSAVIGMSGCDLKSLCHEVSRQMGPDQVVVVANFNTREQLVVSGSPPAVAQVGEKARAAAAKVIPLPVGGAFHSPLMALAAEEFAVKLASCQFQEARIPVVQNFDAQPANDKDQIKKKLSAQMPNSVLWCETIEYMMAAGVDTFIEIGPGKSLSGMVKKINRAARTYNIYSLESLNATMSELKAKTVV